MNLEEVEQRASVLDAIHDAIRYGIEATLAEDIDCYMEGVPCDLRLLEGDGSITDWAALKASQLEAWGIITQTDVLGIDVTVLELGCGGARATARTDERWDRQMLDKDGVTESSIVTTQKHVESWEALNRSWVQVSIEELGGTTVVNGKPY